MTPDQINGAYEFVGSLTIWVNVYALHRDRCVKGVTPLATTFFMSWGCWNLYYYPSLDQWWSFAGGVCIALANAVWLGQMLYYYRRTVCLNSCN